MVRFVLLSGGGLGRSLICRMRCAWEVLGGAFRSAFWRGLGAQFDLQNEMRVGGALWCVSFCFLEGGEAEPLLPNGHPHPEVRIESAAGRSVTVLFGLASGRSVTMLRGLASGRSVTVLFGLASGRSVTMLRGLAAGGSLTIPPEPAVGKSATISPVPAPARFQRLTPYAARRPSFRIVTVPVPLPGPTSAPRPLRGPAPQLQDRHRTRPTSWPHLSTPAPTRAGAPASGSSPYPRRPLAPRRRCATRSPRRNPRRHRCRPSSP